MAEAGRAGGSPAVQVVRVGRECGLGLGQGAGRVAWGEEEEEEEAVERGPACVGALGGLDGGKQRGFS